MTDRLGLLADHAVRSAFGAELHREIEYYASIGSTQDRARQIGRDALRNIGTHRPVIVVADQQTAGHGRGEKSWLSEPGASLLASWTFRPAQDPMAPPSTYAYLLFVFRQPVVGGAPASGSGVSAPLPPAPTKP